MSILGERLKIARERKKLKQTQVKEKTGINNKTLSGWENGLSEPDSDSLRILANLYEVSTDWLLGLTDNPKPFNPETLTKDDFVYLPVLGRIKAGYNLIADQNIIGYSPVPKNEVKDGEYFFLEVTGDSMIEEGIREGSRVLVRKQNYVENGKIAVVLVNGDEATLKRVYYQNDGKTVILQAANPRIPPVVLPADEARIQGKVVKVEFDV